MKRILEIPKYIFENIKNILMWIVLGVIAILGFKLNSNNRNRLREMEKDIEKKQMKKEDLEGKIQHILDDIESRDREIEELKQLVKESKIEDEELREILEKEKEKTDKIKDGEYEKANNDRDSAINLINDILNSD